MSTINAPVYQPRYQAFLDAGSPGGIYSLWSREQWRAYFTEIEGREPGSAVPGCSLRWTESEEISGFVIGHQADFAAWLLARVAASA
jgi:hypothetical protein